MQIKVFDLNGEIGLFYYMPSKIYSINFSLNELQPNEDNILMPYLTHEDFFQELINNNDFKNNLVEKNLSEALIIPRGRVYYSLIDHNFHILTSKMIINSDKIKKKILNAFMIEKAIFENDIEYEIYDDSFFE